MLDVHRKRFGVRFTHVDEMGLWLRADQGFKQKGLKRLESDHLASFLPLPWCTEQRRWGGLRIDFKIYGT